MSETQEKNELLLVLFLYLPYTPKRSPSTFHLIVNMHAPKQLLELFRQLPELKLVAITGGPCAGKSTFLKMAVNLLKKHGFKVFLVSEVARELIASGFAPWNPAWKDPLGFQKQVILGILNKEYWLLEAVREMDHGGAPIVFICDRGVPDGMGYCGEEAFMSLLTELGLTLSDVLNHYAVVLHLVTAAEGAPEFYVTDDERVETLEQAVERDRDLRQAWLQHQHQIVVDNSSDFATKINRALLALQRVLHMPTPTEIEKKYRVLNFSPELVPADAKSYGIVQTYLDRPDRPGIECRVRMKTIENSSSYFYTEKTSTEVDGVRGEHEEELNREDYELYLSRWRKMGSAPIYKTRIKFHHGQHVVELDLYAGRLSGLVMLEIEVPNVEAMASLELPPQFTLVDKTGDKRYSNASLAQREIPKD